MAVFLLSIHAQLDEGRLHLHPSHLTLHTWTMPQLMTVPTLYTGHLHYDSLSAIKRHWGACPSLGFPGNQRANQTSIPPITGNCCRDFPPSAKHVGFHSRSLLQTCNIPLSIKPLMSVSLKWSESHSVVSDSLQPHGLCSPWNSPGQNTGVAVPFSRGSSRTQASCTAGRLCPLSHQESPPCHWLGLFVQPWSPGEAIARLVGPLSTAKQES